MAATHNDSLLNWSTRFLNLKDTFKCCNWVICQSRAKAVLTIKSKHAAAGMLYCIYFIVQWKSLTVIKSYLIFQVHYHLIDIFLNYHINIKKSNWHFGFLLSQRENNKLAHFPVLLQAWSEWSEWKHCMPLLWHTSCWVRVRTTVTHCKKSQNVTREGTGGKITHLTTVVCGHAQHTHTHCRTQWINAERRQVPTGCYTVVVPKPH